MGSQVTLSEIDGVETTNLPENTGWWIIEQTRSTVRAKIRSVIKKIGRLRKFGQPKIS